MIYIENKSTDPYFNQGFEQAVFELCTEGDVLLVWQNSPAVVCGRNQNIFAEVSLFKAKREGVCIVRRDTGGGTVYHDMGNVNYTLISDANGISVSYDRFLESAVSALNRIGVAAHKNKECDIAINGKKISGSAQRQTKSRVLHHGTLLFDTNLDMLTAFSKNRDENFCSKAISSNRSAVTNISCHTGRFKDAAEFKEAFLHAMCDGNIQNCNVLYSDIISRANILKNEKYAAWEWTYGKNPQFLCKRQNGELQVEFSAKHGIITECVITKGNGTVNSSGFIGKRLEPIELEAACKDVLCGENITDLLKLFID